MSSNLIFLISQPRAGSTLTQKILGNHPEIHTVSEPWVMLYPLYALKETGHNAEYNNEFARIGLKGFLSSLSENGKQLYLDHVSQMYGGLYQKMLDTSKKTFFLDKTPRYYNIIPELNQTFPDSKTIILLRNPLAVLCSMLNTWIGDSWLQLQKLRHDILDAPSLLLNGINTLEDNVLVVHYEEILQNFEREVGRICEYLSIDFYPELIDYGNTDSIRWTLGDQKSVYKGTKPDATNAEQWLKALKNPQTWRLVSDYLEILGSTTLKEMGYDYTQLREHLDKTHPGRIKLWNTLPLSLLLTDPSEFLSINYGLYSVKMIASLRSKGILGAGLEAVRKVAKPYHR